MTRLALLGGGRMGEALIGGLLDAGKDPEDVAVAEISPERRHALESRFPKVRVVPAPAWAVAEAEVVVVAVKPGDVAGALQGAASAPAPGGPVLSIAAGVTIAALEAPVRRHLGRDARRGGALGAGRVDPLGRGHGGPGPGGAARCGHRPVRVGPGLRV